MLCYTLAVHMLIYSISVIYALNVCSIEPRYVFGCSGINVGQI